MNNSRQSPLQTFIKEYPLATKLIVGFVVIVILVSVFSLFRTNISFTERAVMKTGLSAENSFAYLHGDSLYAYNGIAFYKRNLESKNVTILNDDYKLPRPTYIYWANDNGAFMTFDESFIASKVEQQIRSSGARMNDTSRGYTWYLDFTDGSLSRVNDATAERNQIYYSEIDNGYYYVVDPGAGTFDPDNDSFVAATIELHFYDIDSKTDSTVVENLQLSNIKTLNACASGAGNICIVSGTAENPISPKLFEISRDSGDMKELFSATGRIIKTNDPKFYLFTDAQEQDVVAGDEIEEEIDSSPAPAQLRDVSSNTSSSLGFDISPDNVIAYFNGSQFFVLDSELSGSINGSEYTVGVLNDDKKGSAKRVPFRFANNNNYGENFLSLTSYADNGSVLLKAFTSDVFLFTPNDIANDWTTAPQSEVASSVSTCSDQLNAENEYKSNLKQFSIYFSEDNQLESNVKQFNECLSDANASGMVDYEFYIGTVSPTNGRITSD